MRILLVEDNPGDADLVREALRDAPALRCELEVAPTLGEGLRRVAEAAPDVALLDLGLPDSRGLETVLRFQREAERVPFIVLTGLHDPALVARALRAGAQDYLVKGRIQGETLARALRYAVDRKQAELALRRSEERFRAVTESAHDAIVSLDDRGAITYLNPAAEQLWGWSQAEALGHPFGLLVQVGGDRGGIEALLRAAGGQEGGGKGGTSELAARHRDGSGFPVEVSLAAHLAGGPSGYTAIVRDIRERRAAEEAERRAFEQRLEIERLREMDRARTMLFNTASHELNTPLTPMRLQVELLRGPALGELNPRQRKALETLERNLDRVVALVEDVLDVARIQSGAMKLLRSDADLASVVAGAAESHQEAARRRGVKLEARCAPGLWAHVDPRRVEQVLYNLLNNALKFTPAGGRVEVTGSREGREVLLRVSDTGMGIAPEDLPRLFQPFSQLHDTMQQTRAGTGLGLYISRGIAELHGGTIEAASPGLEKGATFTVRLPAAQGRAR